MVEAKETAQTNEKSLATVKLVKVCWTTWVVLGVLALVFDVAYLIVTGLILTDMAAVNNVVVGILGFAFTIVNYFLALWHNLVLPVVVGVGVVLEIALMMKVRKQGVEKLPEKTKKRYTQTTVLMLVTIVVTAVIFAIGYALQANYFASRVGLG